MSSSFFLSSDNNTTHHTRTANTHTLANMNASGSKRRRLTDTWTKEFVDTTTTTTTSATPTSTANTMEDLGRQHWHHCNTFPMDTRPLLTSCSSNGQWCYFPKQYYKTSPTNSNNHHIHNTVNWKDVQMYGVPGVHYAIGYKQLGEMIIKYGSDYSTWPTI